MKNLGDEKGLVSLFTTIMISLLLIIITTSLVTLEILQLRKAEDSEQSLRAYYIAEAGIEEKVSQVLANPTNRTDQTCTSSTNYDLSDPTSNWTCQRVSFSGAPTGKLLMPDQGKTVDPGKVNGGYQSVIVEWGQSPVADTSKYTMHNSLPTQGGYNASGYAVPPLEIALVTYPNTAVSASSVGSALKLENALIVPRGGAGNPLINSASLPGHGQWNANCGPLGRSYINGMSGYNCYAVIGNLNAANNNYIFRLRSRYAGTEYRMTFMSNPTGGGAVVKVPDGTATIDVTAKAGTSHRRVLTKLPLGTGAAPGLDYVIYSDTDICKNFNVINNAFPSNPGC